MSMYMYILFMQKVSIHNKGYKDSFKG